MFQVSSYLLFLGLSGIYAYKETLIKERTWAPL